MGAERCPRCLRQTSLVDPSQPDAGSEGPRRPGARALVLVAAYAAFGPLLWIVISTQPWFAARKIEVASVLAAGVLGLLPLRMAFAPPEKGVSDADIPAHYAIRMLAVLALAAGVFAGGVIASHVVESAIAQLFGGLVFGLVPLLVTTSIIEGSKKNESRVAIGMRVAKAVALATLVVGAAVLLGVLKGRRAESPEPKFDGVVRSVDVLDDLEEMTSLKFTKHWRKGQDGKLDLELRVDGGALEPSIQRLYAEALGALPEIEKKDGASGRVRLVLPRALESAAVHPRLVRADADLRSALDQIGGSAARVDPHYEFATRD